MLGKAVGDVIFGMVFCSTFQHFKICRMYQGHGLMNGKNFTLPTWKVQGPKLGGENPYFGSMRPSFLGCFF